MVALGLWFHSLWLSEYRAGSRVTVGLFPESAYSAFTSILFGQLTPWKKFLWLYLLRMNYILSNSLVNPTPVSWCYYLAPLPTTSSCWQCLLPLEMLKNFLSSFAASSILSVSVCVCVRRNIPRYVFCPHKKKHLGKIIPPVFGCGRERMCCVLLKQPLCNPVSISLRT